MQKSQTFAEASAHAKTIHPDAIAHPLDNGTWEIRIPTGITTYQIPDVEFDWSGTPAEDLYNTPADSPHYSNELEKWFYNSEHQGKPLAVLAAYYNLHQITLPILEEIYERELAKVGMSYVHERIKEMPRGDIAVTVDTVIEDLSRQDRQIFWDAYRGAGEVARAEFARRRRLIEDFHESITTSVKRQRRFLFI